LIIFIRAAVLVCRPVRGAFDVYPVLPKSNATFDGACAAALLVGAGFGNSKLATLTLAAALEPDAAVAGCNAPGRSASVSGDGPGAGAGASAPAASPTT